MNSRWTGLRRVEFEARVGRQRRYARQKTPDAAWRSSWLMIALAAGLVALYATGREPVVRMPRSLDFGRVAPHRGDTVQAFSIANVGTSALAISHVEVNGDAVDDFVISDDHCTAAVLAPHTACALAVHFSPPTTGRRNAQLMINDNARNSPQRVHLSGIGTVSEDSRNASLPLDFRLEPRELEFYTKGPAEYVEQSLLIRNIGFTPLRLGDPSIEGKGRNDFRLIRSCANTEIPPGDTCAAIVRFAPTRDGSSVASVTVRAKSAGLVQRSAVLHGTSVTTAAIVDLPRTVNFAPQTVSTETTLQFKVVSSGNAPLHIYKVEPSGDSFSEREDCSGQVLPPGRSCFVSVSFHPQHEGNAKGLVTFQSNASNSPETVTVTGMAAAPPRGSIEFNPSEWNFGNGTVTASGREPLLFWWLAKTFSVKVVNTSPVILGKPIITGQNADDFRLRSECGPALDPGTTCRMKVGFLPHVEGLRTAELSFTGGDKTVVLSGTGVLPTPYTSVEQGRLSVSAVLQSAGVPSFSTYIGSFQMRAQGGSALKTPFTKQMKVGTKVTLNAVDQSCGFEEWHIGEQVSRDRTLTLTLDRDTDIVMVYSCPIP